MYEVDPDYGYRLRPDQRVRRFGGAIVQVNNLGVRACADWTDRRHKVLFLGDSVTYGGSYVTTADLFAVRAAPTGWDGGSAAANGWGIENMHGLVVRHEFLPAVAYVTVVIDRDFYRGFTQRGPLYRTTKPLCALTELAPHVWLNLATRLRGTDDAGGFPEGPGLADRPARAVERLVEMDRFLAGRGFVHLIYVSPTRANLIDGAPADRVVDDALAYASIRVVRLQERIERLGFSRDERAALFHDEFHLTARGHEVWARVIRPDLSAAVETTAAE